MNKKAIVTIATGDQYISNWRKFCEPGWKRYCERHAFDLICIDAPLDNSKRAQARSISWQKCLILDQDFAVKYDRIVWVDSDIIFHPSAPDIIEGVSVEKIGAVEDTSYDDTAYMRRIYKLWPAGEAVINYTVPEYYSQYGLPGDCDRTFNCGVLVLSPHYHRDILRRVYAYEEKEGGGRKWHMEQRPLSYLAVKSDLVQWLDPRFNLVLPIEIYRLYPFLQPPPASKVGILERLQRKIRKMALQRLREDAVNVVFQRSYFLHCGGDMNEMQLIRHDCKYWWDVLSIP